MGIEAKYENIFGAVIYQTQQFSKSTACSILLGLEQNNFQFAYNFDWNLLASKGGNTHEIRVGYLLKK